MHREKACGGNEFSPVSLESLAGGGFLSDKRCESCCLLKGSKDLPCVFSQVAADSVLVHHLVSSLLQRPLVFSSCLGLHFVTTLALTFPPNHIKINLSTGHGV